MLKNRYYIYGILTCEHTFLPIERYSDMYGILVQHKLHNKASSFAVIVHISKPKQMSNHFNNKSRSVGATAQHLPQKVKTSR